MPQPTSLSRLLLGAFCLALAFYATGFCLDRHLRTRCGPWQVTFLGGGTQGPVLLVNQPWLRVTNRVLTFSGERATNAPQTIVFRSPHPELPFGRVKYDDLTSLPGVVTMEVFGHEVELLPRGMYVNRSFYDWRTTNPVVLTAANRPTVLPEPGRRSTSRPF